MRTSHSVSVEAGSKAAELRHQPAPLSRWRAWCQPLNKSWPLLLLLAIAAAVFWPERRIAAHTPDAPDYVLPSVNLVQGNGMVIRVEGQKYPPMHPFGLALLMAPAYALLGCYPGNGVYVVFLTALASVALLWFITQRLFDSRIAWWAGGFLIISGLFRWNAAVIHSDVPSLCFCLAVHALALVLLENARSPRWAWFLWGQLLGFAVAIRWDNFVMFVPAAALIGLRIRQQQKPISKILWAGSGALAWVAALYFANYLYTGDPFRNTNALYASASLDRPGGVLSWRYLFQPSPASSNLSRIFSGALSGWSLDDGDGDAVKRYGYWAVSALALLGILKTVRLARTHVDKRDLLIWAALVAASLVGLYACCFFAFERRYLLRLAVYGCLFQAVAVMAIWDWLGRGMKAAGAHTGAPLRGQIRIPRFRWLAAAPLAGFGLYVLAHPFEASPYSWAPTTQYLEYVRKWIAEDDAVIMSNANAFYVEHLLIAGTHRKFIPVHPDGDGLNLLVQWRKPPHPEWISQDYPQRKGSDQEYARAAANGAIQLFPDNVLEHPQVIASALRSRRKVYLVWIGVYAGADRTASKVLLHWYYFRELASGFDRVSRLPKKSLQYATFCRFAELQGIQTFDTRYAITPTGEVKFPAAPHAPFPP